MSDENPENTDVTDTEEHDRDLPWCVYHSLGLIRNGMDNGARAQLRRASANEPYSSALWRLLAGLPDRHVGTPDLELKWGMFFQAMMHGWEDHDASTHLGTALAAAGYSELRLEKLLRSDEARLGDELRKMAKFLASKSQPLNWVDVAWLLFASSAHAKSHRRAIARRYYRHLHVISKD